MLLLLTMRPVGRAFFVASVECFDTPEGMLRDLPERAAAPPHERCIPIFDHVTAAVSYFGLEIFEDVSNPLRMSSAKTDTEKMPVPVKK